MIEAPEALYLCEQLNKTVKGKRITNVFTLFTPHKFAWFSGSPDEYAEWLTGKSIDHARSQGGMVEMTIGDKMLILTDVPDQPIAVFISYIIAFIGMHY